jgi:hypothetical protein
MRPARLAARHYLIFSASGSSSLSAVTLFKLSATAFNPGGRPSAGTVAACGPW